jgi:Fe-S cluster assembly ATP-binding protein
MAFEISNLWVKIEGKEILRGLSLKIEPGEIVALMGPNGSGKSTLACSLMGHPNYKVIRKNSIRQLADKKLKAVISLDGEDITNKTPDQRAKVGLFLAMQYPVSIPGVSVREALLAAIRSKTQKLKNSKTQNVMSALDLKKLIEKEARELTIDSELLKRGLNEGFSGGEKKKMEILQMRILSPKYTILDETDSGLDIDALKIVAKGANYLAKKKKTGILVITHYQRLLSYLKPDRVLVMKDGEIVREGGIELVRDLEKNGYKDYV